jgi:hypothetical protein
MAEGYIDWDDIVGEDGYRVKWGTTQGGPYTFTQDVSANATSLYITGLTAGVTYYATVTGLLAGVEQTPSGEISFTANDYSTPTSGVSRRINIGVWA